MGAKHSQESSGPVATAQQNARSHQQHHHHSQHPLTLSHPGLSRPSSPPSSMSREHHRHHSPSQQPHPSNSRHLPSQQPNSRYSPSQQPNSRYSPSQQPHPSNSRHSPSQQLHPSNSHRSQALFHPHRGTTGGMLSTSYSHPSAHSQPPHLLVSREGERDRERRGLQSQRPDFVALDFTMPSLDQRLVPIPRSARSSGSGSRSRGERGERERRRRGHRLNDLQLGAFSSSAPVGSLLIVRGISRVKCPLCSKEVVSTELEEHLVTCMSRPRVMYNDDTLIQDAGECSICLDDMMAGDKIARLPCLCVYHIKCLQQWYTVSQTCPEHPESDYKSA